MIQRLFLGGALTLALAACAAETPLPDASYLTAPAALAVAPRQTGYVSPIQNYTARPVTDPSDWRELNQLQEGT